MRNDEYGRSEINGNDLDNYITGHYGEDQFTDADYAGEPDECISTALMDRYMNRETQGETIARLTAENKSLRSVIRDIEDILVKYSG